MRYIIFICFLNLEFISFAQIVKIEGEIPEKVEAQDLDFKLSIFSIDDILTVDFSENLLIDGNSFSTTGILRNKSNHIMISIEVEGYEEYLKNLPYLKYKNDTALIKIGKLDLIPKYLPKIALLRKIKPKQIAYEVIIENPQLIDFTIIEAKVSAFMTAGNKFQGYSRDFIVTTFEIHDTIEKVSKLGDSSTNVIMSYANTNDKSGFKVPFKGVLEESTNPDMYKYSLRLNIPMNLSLVEKKNKFQLIFPKDFVIKRISYSIDPIDFRLNEDSLPPESNKITKKGIPDFKGVSLSFKLSPYGTIECQYPPIDE